MKFTDGFWQLREEFTALYAQEAHDIWERDGALEVYAPTKAVEQRGHAQPLHAALRPSCARGARRGTRGARRATALWRLEVVGAADRR